MSQNSAISKMETTQTAVDWLENELHNFIHPEHGKDFLPILLQAKEMEKKQIMNAYIDGELQQGFEAEAEQYYNETYGSNNQI